MQVWIRPSGWPHDHSWGAAAVWLWYVCEGCGVRASSDQPRQLPEPSKSICTDDCQHAAPSHNSSPHSHTMTCVRPADQSRCAPSRKPGSISAVQGTQSTTRVKQSQLKGPAGSLGV
eukprot:361697-Chlamydomonas_euryale.AAC.1